MTRAQSVALARYRRRQPLPQQTCVEPLWDMAYCQRGINAYYRRTLDTMLDDMLAAPDLASLLSPRQ